MRETVIVLTFLVFSSLPASAQQAARPATEQAWILSDVVAAIEGMSGKAPLPAPVIADHVWSPATYRAAAEAAFEAAPADTDLNVRASLVNLTSTTLLEQSRRVSLVLEADLRRPGAHEAAALVVGALALREASGWFDDTRPALSRIAAHLAVARALRRPATDETLDGTVARAILAALVGRQRDAMAIVDAIEARAGSDADRAWVRALRLRITGDWRATFPAGSPLLVQLEQGRALRERLGIDAFMVYVKGLDGHNSPDWARISFSDGFSIEAGQQFVPTQLRDEIVETAAMWMGMQNRQEPPDERELLRALDARPAASPVERTGELVTVRVLDWGMWAAYQQRHVAHALIASSYLASLLGDEELSGQVTQLARERFGTLRLWPVALRWMAQSKEEYAAALQGARVLARETPEILTQSVWTLLLEKPAYVSRSGQFPIDRAWFTPAVPAGTAFDLPSRSLRPGCPRPPTREQAASWAREMPYDHWTVWGDQWLSVDGKPSLTNVRKAFGPLLEYDAEAASKILDYMDLSMADAIDSARTLCGLVPGKCDRLAELLLVANRLPEAAQTYDRWVEEARDRVRVAEGVTWLFRYHLTQGNATRADALGRMAEETGSWDSLELAAEWHERRGRPQDADRILHDILDRYDDSTPLGAFLMRRGLAAHDRALQAQAGDLMRDEFPEGPEPLVMHALPAKAGDGIRFKMFGPRLQSLGFEPADIIVGIDGWRVHDYDQYQVAVRFTFDETMTYTVFRKGRYQQVRVSSPERWLGTQFTDVQ